MAEQASKTHRSFSPVERPEKTAFVVARALAEHIADMAPGDQLAPEHQLIAEFAVGRSTMREALRLLELQGLLSIRTGRNGGPIVREPDPAALAQTLSLLLSSAKGTFRQVISARAAIEAALAKLAAENRTEQDIVAIELSLEKMGGQLDDEVEFLAENARFHSACAEASKNPVLALFLASLRTVYDGHVIGVTYSDRELLHIHRYHERVAKAIIAGFPGEAATAMNVHMDAFLAYLEKDYGSFLDDEVKWVF